MNFWQNFRKIGHKKRGSKIFSPFSARGKFIAGEENGRKGRKTLVRRYFDGNQIYAKAELSQIKVLKSNLLSVSKYLSLV